MAVTKLPAHTLPDDLRSRRIRSYSRAEWRLRLHKLPVGLLRQRHLVTHRARRRSSVAA
jgi:hypothetical protein